ncbi:MAG: hypothetical protein HQM12_11520 [SAR324 cluster bacterium]|nr:hypothetical protein [SAR324 cluster bacterium]
MAQAHGSPEAMETLMQILNVFQQQMDTNLNGLLTFINDLSSREWNDDQYAAFKTAFERHVQAELGFTSFTINDTLIPYLNALREELITYLGTSQ